MQTNPVIVVRRPDLEMINKKKKQKQQKKKKTTEPAEQ